MKPKIRETTICFFLNSMPPPSAFHTIINEAPYTIADIYLVYILYSIKHEDLMMIRFYSCFFLSCYFDLKKKELLIIYLLFILFCGDLSYHSNEYMNIHLDIYINFKEKNRR